MKKITSILMAGLLVAMLVACGKDNPKNGVTEDDDPIVNPGGNNNDDDNKPGGEETPAGDAVVIATLPPMVKVSLDEFGKLAWEEGDKIGVFTSANRLVEFSLTAGAGTKAGTFSAKLEEGETLGGYALYPYNEADSYDGTTMTVNLPERITPSDKITLPMAAKIDADGKATFAISTGVLRLRVNSVPHDGAQVVLLANNKKIAGALKMDLSGDAPVVKSEESTGSSVRYLIKPANSAYGTYQIVYVPLPAATYNDIQIYAVNYDAVSDDDASTVVYLNNEIKSDQNVIKMGELAKLDINPSIIVADFEGDKADISGLVDPGTGTEIYTVVDNAHKTEVNESAHALYSSYFAGSTGAIPETYFEINVSASNPKIPNAARRDLARAVGIKLWVGSDAGKYFPYIKMAWTNPYLRPTYINGVEVTNENITSLCKENEWNQLVYVWSLWESKALNAIQMHPVCGPDGAATGEEGERKIYFDDLEILF